MKHATVDSALLVRSATTGLTWPGLPGVAGRKLLSILYQLDLSQWHQPLEVQEAQLRQLRALLAHALSNCPHYREQHGLAGMNSASISAADFRAWPILRKRDVARIAPRLRADLLPASHGGRHWSATSGSTGMPLRIALSDVNSLIQSALVLRSQLWHHMDFGARFAAIKPGVDQAENKDWGPVSSAAWSTGPSFTCDVRTDVAQQLEWLCRVEPAYLLSYGANLLALVEMSAASGRLPKGLRKVVLFGDSAPAKLRPLMREVWNVELVDIYSCGEFGSLAFQCPDEPECHHVQAESVYLEVLKDDGSPCAPGEPGRVVVTDLHNFAMPMIRYELGDVAIPGPPCRCGRGLPVLAQVLGRYRNMAVDPAGRRFYPAIRTERLLACAPIRQLQMLQLRPDLIEFRYVMDRDLIPAEVDSLRAQLAEAFMYPFELRATRVDAVERAASGKFEEFISMVETS